MNIISGYLDMNFVGKFQCEVFAGAALASDGSNACVFADTVRGMDNVIADL